ncbi:uncharacterized protein LOC131846526 [Achroia grisella]|uniref:uncharacterized protein LOC131846526 n=1 Tax=Achroia grisella TaxID=688607 RepID=UPI0027D1FA64|nr:uncharacterized protein LOC131846526 [Achroia grisella]XP_059051840.1 uncharacterized protein LOC131846526 [Achroia grisella]
MDYLETENFIDQLIQEYDETSMSVPEIEFQPHLLISRVRKHYMDYIIKMLSINYETNQRLLNKNIYLPSAIWRCAKKIEMTAAQTCMVAQVYRKNITTVIKDLKNDTTKGKLYRSLYDCLKKPPENDKKTQTTGKSNDCTCPCICNQRKRARLSDSPKICLNDNLNTDSAKMEQMNTNQEKQFTIPVIENLQAQSPKIAIVSTNNAAQAINDQLLILNQESVQSSKPLIRMSVESSDSTDELMLQLEKLFQGDPNDDDLFEGTLCDTYDVATHVEKKCIDTLNKENQIVIQNQDEINDSNSALKKTLDERLQSLAGLLVNNNNDDCTIQQKSEILKKKNRSSKWLCEEYFLKVKLYELMDQIRDCNRKKYSRIKQKLVLLFGDDCDDDSIMSPLDESSEFIISCKERIAPWVVKLLTPYYIKGRIRGKVLFKAVAKHLIRLIYQCSRYPHEYEVHSFVSDFLENHKMIRCEADFKQFRIDNL